MAQTPGSTKSRYGSRAYPGPSVEAVEEEAEDQHPEQRLHEAERQRHRPPQRLESSFAAPSAQHGWRRRAHPALRVQPRRAASAEPSGAILSEPASAESAPGAIEIAAGNAQSPPARTRRPGRVQRSTRPRVRTRACGAPHSAASVPKADFASSCGEFIRSRGRTARRLIPRLPRPPPPTVRRLRRLHLHHPPRRHHPRSATASARRLRDRPRLPGEAKVRVRRGPAHGARSRGRCSRQKPAPQQRDRRRPGVSSRQTVTVRAADAHLPHAGEPRQRGADARPPPRRGSRSSVNAVRARACAATSAAGASSAISAAAVQQQRRGRSAPPPPPGRAWRPAACSPRRARRRARRHRSRRPSGSRLRGGLVQQQQGGAVHASPAPGAAAAAARRTTCPPRRSANARSPYPIHHAGQAGRPLRTPEGRAARGRAAASPARSSPGPAPRPAPRTPPCARRPGRSRRGSIPSTRTVPASAAHDAGEHRSSVLFPEPLAPISPTSAPAGTCEVDAVQRADAPGERLRQRRARGRPRQSA